MDGQREQSSPRGVDGEACIRGLAVVVADAVAQQLAGNGPIRNTAVEAEVREERRPQLLLTVSEAAECLAIGRTAAYALVSSGELESVRIGRLRRVPISAIEEYVNRLRGLDS